MTNAESIERYCTTLTETQLERLDREIFRRIRRTFAGGLCFGVDWPTLAIVRPGLAVALAVVRQEQAYAAHSDLTFDEVDGEIVL